MKSITKTARLILSGVFVLLFAAFNLILFLAAKDFQKGSSFWTAYIFVSVAFLSVVCTTLLSTRKDKDGVLFAMPLVFASCVYLSLEFILGIVFMFLPDSVALWTGVGQGVMLVIYLVVILLAMLGIIFVKRNQEYVAQKVAYISVLKDEVALLAASEKDSDVAKALGELSEDIRFSDPLSTDEVAPMERQLVDEVRAFPTLDTKEAKLSKIQDMKLLLQKRNARVKTLKS